MNSFTKCLLTGVFGVVVWLLISGSNYQVEDYGKWEKYRVGSDAIGTYQISTTTGDDSGTIRIFETIIDTRSGRVISRKKTYDDYYPEHGPNK